MNSAKTGDTVKVHFTGSLQDGTRFGSSVGSDPLEFTLGTGDVIPGFETVLLGMTPGETKTVTIPHDQAFGPRKEESVREFPRSVIPEDVDLRVGLQLQASDPEGQTVVVTVASFTDDKVILDGNHPLAGEDLVVEVELLEIY